MNLAWSVLNIYFSEKKTTSLRHTESRREWWGWPISGVVDTARPPPSFPAVAVPLTSYCTREGDEWWGCCVVASPLNPHQRLSAPTVIRQGCGNPIITRLHCTPPAQLPASQMFPIKKEAFLSGPIFCTLRERKRRLKRGVRDRKNGLLQKYKKAVEGRGWHLKSHDGCYLTNGR